MAHVKSTARKETSGKAPHKKLATKLAVHKPPCCKGMCEEAASLQTGNGCSAQNPAILEDYDLLIPMAPMSRAGREVMTQVEGGNDLRFQSIALAAIHEACEAFTVGLM